MTQVYNPLRFHCAPNQATPDYIVYDDFRMLVAYGLICCWLSADPDDCNRDCSFSRPVDHEDVQELRRQFLDLLDTIIVALWQGDYEPGHGWIDGDYQYTYIGAEDDPTLLSWQVRLDDDSTMLCLQCTGADDECIWLSYEGIADRQNVLQVLREAREVTGTGTVWDTLETEAKQATPA